MGAFFFKKIIIYSFIWLYPVLVAAISSVFVAARRMFCWGMWDLVSWPGIEPRPPALAVWNPSHWITVGILYRPGPGGPESTKRREKKRESSISQVTWKINEAHAQEYHSRRHRASSQGGLESPGKNVSSVGFHAPKRMKTKRGTWGTQVSSGARVFY